jgi:hypothetical protein
VDLPGEAGDPELLSPMKTTFLTLAAASLMAGGAFAQQVALPPVDLTKKIPAEAATKVYQVLNGEAAVKSTLVKRIEFGEGTALVSLQNLGKEKARPDFTVRLFNAAGLEVGHFRVSWTFESLEPGAIKVENAKFAAPTLDEFRFTELVFPADWKKPAWVAIDGPAF